MKISNSAERINELLNHYGITQKEFCERTGLDKSVVSLYVSGKREPRQDKLYIISETYNVDPAWLMGLDVPMRKNDNIDIMSKYESGVADTLVGVKNDPQLQRLVNSFKELGTAQKEVVLDLVDIMRSPNKRH